ncbi:MAG: hypothetical protein RLZZ535_3555, partial [Cyanobacteriota bacterium]
MLRKKLCTILIVIIGITAWVLPVKAAQLAQLPFIQDIAIYSRLLRQVQDNSLNSACIRLDGRCLFKLSATDPELLADRIGEIQKRFGQVSADYLAVPNSQSEVTVKPNGNLQDLYITIGDRSERLFTVTNIDAEANDVGVP